MDFFTLIGTGIALGMDTFAVAAAASATIRDFTARHTFRLTWHFGLFQALMTVIGWCIGSGLAEFLTKVDHWVAFGLLAFVGTKMILESRAADDRSDDNDPTRGKSLVYLSVATSIDALAVGLSFNLIGVSVLGPALVIGLTSAAMTFTGTRIGLSGRSAIGKRAELIGGLVLVGIGIKIVIDHLTA